MFEEAPTWLQFVVAIGTIAATAFVLGRLGLAMSVASQARWRTADFWWRLALFMGPLALVNWAAFDDTLFLQLELIALIAGVGVGLGNWVLLRRR
jgi:hypothetical protein